MNDNDLILKLGKLEGILQQQQQSIDSRLNSIEKTLEKNSEILQNHEKIIDKASMFIRWSWGLASVVSSILVFIFIQVKDIILKLIV